LASHQHPDFNPLLEILLCFAKKFLAEKNAFLPFAAVMSSDGEVSYVAGDTGDEPAGAPMLLQVLEGALREMIKKDNLKAAGICVDIRFAASPEEPKTDAIQVFLEHREGNVVNLLLPYKKIAPGQISYGKLIAVRGEPKIFLIPQ
jgi:hypothetical protein